MNESVRLRLENEMKAAFIERSDPDDGAIRELTETIRPYVAGLSDEEVVMLLHQIEQHMLYYDADHQVYVLREVNEEGEIWDEELAA